jgi:hypothetical protein
MKQLLLAGCILILWTVSCKKPSTVQTVHTPVPFLTGRLWTLDTITINPPAIYNQLSASDQRAYDLALGWEKGATVTFNEDGTVTCEGDWDFGYYKWRMIHDSADIEVLVSIGTKDTLFNWAADSQQFTYLRSFNPSFECTMVYH